MWKEYYIMNILFGPYTPSNVLLSMLALFYFRFAINFAEAVQQAARRPFALNIPCSFHLLYHQ